MKRDEDLALEPEEAESERQSFSGIRGNAIRKLMATYLRMRDVGRIMRLGMTEQEGDARGWAAVSLIQLKKYKEAAQLAAGPDGETPCGYQTLRYVAHSLAKAGAMEAALHLSKLQRKCGRTKYITGGAREMQSILEVSSLYLQATSQNDPKLLAAHGAQVSLQVEQLLGISDDVLAITPHRRYLMLTEAFNQVIRWYGRARLIPQALRACEIMNELGIPRNDMTIHFLSRGCAPQFSLLKRAKTFSQVPPDWPGKRPEVVFIGRTNSGKSSMINSLFSTLTKLAPRSKIKAWTRSLDFYEVNRERSGLPHFMLVDTPGLGYAGVEARITRSWPELIYSYLKQRESLVHVFHLCDARNKKLLPADKQLIHLLASAQRQRVRYTIVITKIDVCTRRMANATAKAIRDELAPYVDVDIMFASAKSLRGVDHLWAKIWNSVTETPRGKRHRELGAKELALLRTRMGKTETLADKLGIVESPTREATEENFDSENWEDDEDFKANKPGTQKSYFADRWDEDLDEDDEFDGFADDDLEGFEDDDLEGFEDDDDEAINMSARGNVDQRWRDEDNEDLDLEDELNEEELSRRWQSSEGSEGASAAPGVRMGS